MTSKKSLTTGIVRRKSYLKIIIEAYRFKKKERGRTSWVWCPACKHDLNGDDDSFVEDTDLVYYECARCGCKSAWYFDTPAPHVVKRSYWGKLATSKGKPQ